MTQKTHYTVGRPLVAGERRVYLINRVAQHRGCGHVVACNSPLGLLVVEGEAVYFSPFDPGFAPADILPLLEEIRMEEIALSQE